MFFSSRVLCCDGDASDDEKEIRFIDPTIINNELGIDTDDEALWKEPDVLSPPMSPTRAMKYKQVDDCSTSLEQHLNDYALIRHKLHTTLRQLRELDNQTLAEIKAYRKPPQSLHVLIACCYLLCGGKSTEWGQCKSFLTTSKNKLQNFDFHNVDKDALERSRQFAMDNEALFSTDRVDFAGDSGKILFKWLQSVWYLHKETQYLALRHIDPALYLDSDQSSSSYAGHKAEYTERKYHKRQISLNYLNSKAYILKETENQ